MSKKYPGEGDTVRVSISITEKANQELEFLSEITGQPRSEIIRKGVLLFRTHVFSKAAKIAEEL